MVGLVASTVGDRAKIAKGICVFQQEPLQYSLEQRGIGSALTRLEAAASLNV